ncbi:hypothetical protein OAS39_06420 [Pirellulales bacterium]|nr:hypothetical protein [Pirellulales bacterium]
MTAESPIFALPTDGALHQGEVLSNVRIYERLSSDTETAKFTEVTHPYCVVVSQECDLQWDYDARYSGENEVQSPRLLPHILCCTAATEEEIRSSRSLKSDLWRRVKKNKDDRYQYLEACGTELDAVGTGVPALVLDFKRYFTLPTSDLYEQLSSGAEMRYCLVSPYVEHLSLRFAFFQARVALPRDHG